MSCLCAFFSKINLWPAVFFRDGNVWGVGGLRGPVQMFWGQMATEGLCDGWGVKQERVDLKCISLFPRQGVSEWEMQNCDTETNACFVVCGVLSKQKPPLNVTASDFVGVDGFEPPTLCL